MAKVRHPLRRDREEKPSLLETVMRTRKQLEDKRGSYFTAKEGVNRVRIMPSWRGVGEQFYLQIPTHKNIGPEGKWATCLQFWQEACPVCRAIDRLSSSQNSRDQNLASKMMPDDRILMNVGYPNDEDGIVKPWSMSESFFLEILGYFGDPEYGDFTDPHEGYDYVFTRKGTGMATKYTNKHFATRPSAVKIPGAKKKLINLDQFPKRYSMKEMRAFLRGEEE
jgi:hypothetical protein